MQRKKKYEKDKKIYEKELEVFKMKEKYDAGGEQNINEK